MRIRGNNTGKRGQQEIKLNIKGNYKVYILSLNFLEVFNFTQF
jgi:hypothetical protein